MRRRRCILPAALALVGVVALLGPTQPAAAQAMPAADFITGTGDRTNPHVVTYSATGQALGGFMAFGAPTGARVAAGDLGGDPQPEIVVGTGPGFGSQVRVFTQSGALLGAFAPYGGFPGGVHVAVGDVDGDSLDEIVTGAGAGGGPHVIVWDWNNGTATARASWYAYDAGFHGGVRVSVADLVGSPRADVVTAPGPGGGPHVRLWELASNTPTDAGGWMAYAPSFTGGVNVSAGTIGGSRGVVTGPGPGGGPHVRLFSPNGSVRSEFFAYHPSFTGGVNVLLSAPRGGNLGHVITAPASWAGPHVRGFNTSGQELFGFMAYGGHAINGINLARVPTIGSTNNTNQNGSDTSVGG